MKKSILVLALCFILLFAVAAVSAQEVETPAEEPVAEEAVSEEAAEEVAADSACEKAADPSEYKVTYLGNDCLAEVPVDCSGYAPGTEVTVKFDPVKYMDYKVFYGWDIDDDGIADFGYNYDKFEMPENDVELKAICVAPYWGGAASCPGCHLHGTYVDQGLQTFHILPYGGVK